MWSSVPNGHCTVFYLDLRKTLWNYDLRLRYTDSETIEIKYNRITEKQWRDYEVKQEKPKQNCLKKLKKKTNKRVRHIIQ